MDSTSFTPVVNKGGKEVRLYPYVRKDTKTGLLEYCRPFPDDIEVYEAGKRKKSYFRSLATRDPAKANVLAEEKLAEYRRIVDSERAKEASWSSAPVFGVLLKSPTPNISEAEVKQSTEGEMLLAGQKIGEKVFRNNAPTKFPEIYENGPFHVILVDMRGYLINGGDLDDYAQIALGPKWVSCPEFVLHWENPKTKRVSPIRGLFEMENPLKAAPYLQQRIHMIGFIPFAAIRLPLTTLTTKLYDRRGYNPEKSASFFATY